VRLTSPSTGLGALILVTGVGSAIFGWLYHLWWLAVPPILISAFMGLLAKNTVRELKRHGIGAFDFILWNTAINFVIFGAAWLLQRL
jgi:hypothetical protein